MRPYRAAACFAALALVARMAAQPDTLLLAFDEHYVMGDAGQDPLPDLSVYERFNPALGGDSVRQCGGFPCTGWVEDRYEDGQLKHKGYYDQGRVVLFKNYYANGTLEREFKQAGGGDGLERSWHPNGQPRSAARYADGEAVHYQDHYVTGALRYVEERQKGGGCYTRMALYAADGKPISLLAVIDKGRGIVEVSEYHPGGALKAKGRARCDRRTRETARIGTWSYYDPGGALVREEDYIDGKVHAVR